MSDSAAQHELIQNWLAVNPGTEDQARFYLEANNWDLNAALSNFYEEPPLSEGLPQQHQGDLALPLDPNLISTVYGSPQQSIAAPVVSAGPVNAAAAVPQASMALPASVPRRRYGTGSRIATLSSLGNQDAGGDSDSDSQEWYAGGERSGMAIKPPTKDADEPEGGSLVDRILRRAAEGGTAPGPGSGHGESGPSRPRTFAGRGRMLGNPGSSVGGTTMGDAADSSGSELSDAGDNDEVAVRELTFWRNGFSLGDGPLFNTEDPVNRQNLEAILQGRAPLDILNVRPGQQVEMKVTNRRDEDYVPPAQPPAQPFSGQGHRLGGITPAATSSTISSASASRSQAEAGRPILLDQSQPVVQVQIRLADGTRLVARVNASHTVGDLRAFVLSERPEAGQRSFAFKSIMPPKVLGDDMTTIAQAGIANAAIAQYFI
ncbi:protein phosphatase regulator [Coemansia sp. RSA 2050]|nr:protein phosphatase regulator [Coemansia sp. RSA 2050]KAJ2736955.1 protein phosphatase regulator [Coemansia sp. BCRC 34962]